MEGRMVPAYRRRPRSRRLGGVKALAVLAGDSARVAADITAEADAAGLIPEQRNGADTCVRYLIGDRLDITGARWGLEGAEAILTLRAVISNGDFEEYWLFHLAREHQRLHPGTTQGQYTLGA